MTSQEAEDEAELEEQLVAAVVADAQSSVVLAVEASGTFLSHDLIRLAFVTILCGPVWRSWVLGV